MTKILKKTTLIALVATTAFIVTTCVSSCSKDKLVNYEVPEFSVEDYYNLLNITDQAFIKKYPYAIDNKGVMWKIRSYIKEDPLLKAQATILYFTNSNKLSGISVGEMWESKNVDRFFDWIPIVNNFTDDIKFIRIIFKNSDIINDEKEFSSIEALKKWIEEEEVKEEIELKVIHLKWAFPENRRNYSVNDNVSLVYRTDATSTGNIAINFSIGNYDYSFE